MKEWAVHTFFGKEEENFYQWGLKGQIRAPQEWSSLEASHALSQMPGGDWLKKTLSPWSDLKKAFKNTPDHPLRESFNQGLGDWSKFYSLTLGNSGQETGEIQWESDRYCFHSPWHWRKAMAMPWNFFHGQLTNGFEVVWRTSPFSPFGLSSLFHSHFHLIILKRPLALLKARSDFDAFLTRATLDSESGEDFIKNFNAQGPLFDQGELFLFDVHEHQGWTLVSQNGYWRKIPFVQRPLSSTGSHEQIQFNFKDSSLSSSWSELIWKRDKEGKFSFNEDKTVHLDSLVEAGLYHQLRQESDLFHQLQMAQLQTEDPQEQEKLKLFQLFLEYLYAQDLKDIKRINSLLKKVNIVTMPEWKDHWQIFSFRCFRLLEDLDRFGAEEFQSSDLYQIMEWERSLPLKGFLALTQKVSRFNLSAQDIQYHYLP